MSKKESSFSLTHRDILKDPVEKIVMLVDRRVYRFENSPCCGSTSTIFMNLNLNFSQMSACADPLAAHS